MVGAGVAATGVLNSPFVRLVEAASQAPAPQGTSDGSVLEASAQTPGGVPDNPNLASPIEQPAPTETVEYCDPERRYCRNEYRVGLFDIEMQQYYPLGADYSVYELYANATRSPVAKMYVAHGMNGDPIVEFDDRVHSSWNDEAGVFDTEEFGKWVTPPIIELDNICRDYQMFDSSYTGRIILDNIEHYGTTRPRGIPIRCLGAEPVVQLDSEKLKHPGTSGVSFLDIMHTKVHESLHVSMMIHGIDREPRGIEAFADGFALEHMPAMFTSDWQPVLGEYIKLRREVDAILFYEYHSLALRREEILTEIPDGELGYQHGSSLISYLMGTSGTSWNELIARLKNLPCAPLGRNDRFSELFDNLSWQTILGYYLAHAFYPQRSGHHDDLFDPIREKLESNITTLGTDQPQTLAPNHFGYYEVDATNPNTHIAVDSRHHETTLVTTIGSRGLPVELPPNESLKPPLPNPQALPIAVYNARTDEELIFTVRNTTPPRKPIFMPLTLTYNESGSEAALGAEETESKIDAATLAQHFSKLAESARDTDLQEQKRREFRAFVEEHKWLLHSH